MLNKPKRVSSHPRHFGSAITLLNLSHICLLVVKFKWVVAKQDHFEFSWHIINIILRNVIRNFVEISFREFHILKTFWK